LKQKTKFPSTWGMIFCLIVGFSLFPVGCEKPPGLRFVISYDSDVSEGPITGRVYVMIAKDDIRSTAKMSKGSNLKSLLSSTRTSSGIRSRV